MKYHKHKPVHMEDSLIIFCSECGKILKNPDNMEIRKCDMCGRPLMEGIIRNDVFTGKEAYLCNKCKRRYHM